MLPVTRTKTTCPYCGVGCGVIATKTHDGRVTIAGDPDHPANFGRLCSKGSALADTLVPDGRLLYPTVGGRQASWEEAVRTVATGFTDVIEKHGPQSVAFYLSGQLLTEDYYVANKLIKGFIGSPHVDTNSRLCMASTVAGHKRAFGSDTVPGTYQDLDEADLIVLVGSNAAWCHPILFQRMQRNQQDRHAKIVVIDTRRTATAEEADLFLQIAPGMDTLLFSGLLCHLADRGVIDHLFVERHTEGMEAALQQAREIAPDVSCVAAGTGLSAADVQKFYELFAATPKCVTAFSQGVNQSAQGTDKVNAIINVHLLTGRIGQLGAGPFSLTGQPNAMGGREVGGMANTLAAHMGFSPVEIDRVRRFWDAPNMVASEGHKAVALFDAIGRGEIKALWVMGTNPAVSLPNAKQVRDAMSRLELLVVSDVIESTDTIDLKPHVLFPAAAWGEKDGTVTNSERRISRQRAFLPLPAGALPDWKILSLVAAEMGHGNAFAYRSAAEIFREHAALSAFENNGERDFDIGALAEIGSEEFESLAPVLWPYQKGKTPTERPFSGNRFFHPNGRARFVAPAMPVLAEQTGNDMPYRLNTGRIRDQWHTMTRTGLSAKLSIHWPEPKILIHPHDAGRLGVSDGGYVRIKSQHGDVTVAAQTDPSVSEGQIFAPIHWSDQTASSACVGGLVTPNVDPISGQPEAKATPCKIYPVSFPIRALVLSKRSIRLPGGLNWTRIRLNGGYAYTCATEWTPDQCFENIEKVLSARFADAHVTNYVDGLTGEQRRAAYSTDGWLGWMIATSHRGHQIPWQEVASAFEAPMTNEMQRRLLLAGRTGQFQTNSAVVCACHGVREAEIDVAIRSGKCQTVESIGLKLKAGTNCGSCIPELKVLLRRAQSPKKQVA